MKRSVDIVVKAHDKASKNFRKMGNEVGFVEKNLGKLKAVAAAYIALRLVKAIASQTTEMLKLMDRTAKFADVIGINVEELQRLQYAAQISGISIEHLDKSFAILIRRIGEAVKGSGEAARGIEMMGVPIEKLIVMRPEQLFAEIAEAIKKQKTPAEQAALAYYMFGRQGIVLIKMLRLGKDELEALGDEAERTGGIFSREMAAKAEEANDAMTRATWAMRKFKIEMAIGFAPAIEKTATWMAKLNEKIRDVHEWMYPGAREWRLYMEELSKEEKVSKATIDADIESTMKLAEAIDKLNEKLKQQLYTYRMTNREKERYRLELMGATEEQLERAKRLDETLTWVENRDKALKKQAKTNERFRKSIQDLTKELTLLNRTATELEWKEFEWKMEGFNTEQIEYLAELTEKIAALQKQQANIEIVKSRPGIAAIEGRFLSRVPGQEPIKNTAKNTKDLVVLAKEEKGRDETLIEAVQELADRGVVLQPAEL